MQTLTITKVVLSPAPGGNTQCSVYYSLGSTPTTWVLINNNVTVPPSGVLGAALVVDTIPDGETSVNVRAVANCGGTPYDENVPTGTTTTTTTGGTTTTTTAATTTTTTTAGTTTTTTAATTTTTTTAATTTTTTSTTTTTTTSTTTTTTTSAGETFDLVVTKEVPNDEVSVEVLLGGTPIAGSPFVSPAGGDTTFTGVFDVTQSFYFINVTVTSVGGVPRPIDITDNTGSLGSTAGGSTLSSTGHDGADGNVTVAIGT